MAKNARCLQHGVPKAFEQSRSAMGLRKSLAGQVPQHVQGEVGPRPSEKSRSHDSSKLPLLRVQVAASSQEQQCWHGGRELDDGLTPTQAEGRCKQGELGLDGECDYSIPPNIFAA